MRTASSVGVLPSSRLARRRPWFVPALVLLAAAGSGSLGTLLAARMLGPAVRSASRPALQPLPRPYRVEPGDTLARVAERVGIALPVLAASNHLRPTSGLRPGQILYLWPDRAPQRGVTAR